MIITRKKDLDQLIELISGKSVFIMGCSQCATLCNTGGEEEVIEMKKNLERSNINVTGWVILDPACNFLNNKRILREYTDDLDKAEKILVLACGNGAQTVSDFITDRDVISGVETLFLGEVKRFGDFEKKCSLCGECVRELFAGFCPVSLCPKSMLNGPCGGSVNGKCEVNENVDCVWILIYNRLKEKNQLEKMKKISEPKDWSKSTEMKWRI